MTTDAHDCMKTSASERSACCPHLLARLVRSKRDAQDGSDDTPKLDDLVNAATYNVYRDSKAYSAVSPAW